MDDKKLNQRLLAHAIKYYGKNRFKRLFNSRYQAEIKRGGKGDIPNLVLRQLGCMTKFYGPYKEDETDYNS